VLDPSLRWGLLLFHACFAVVPAWPMYLRRGRSSPAGGCEASDSERGPRLRRGPSRTHDIDVHAVAARGLGRVHAGVGQMDMASTFSGTVRNAKPPTLAVTGEGRP
jgi:hypothetical protein